MEHLLADATFWILISFIIFSVVIFIKARGTILGLIDGKIENIKNENINSLKILLANETTKMLHGKLDARKAENTAIQTFEKRETGESLPRFEIKKSEIDNMINIVELSVKSGLVSSKSEARRAIKNHGIKLNNVSVQNEKLIIEQIHFKNNICKISFGKKKHIIVTLI